MQNRFSK